MNPVWEQLPFYVLAALIIGSAICVVTLRNIFHCALCLALSFASVAGVYVLLRVPFLAAVQVLIYVGAVAVLILFAIMLTHQVSGRQVAQTNRQSPISVAIAIGFLAMIIGLIRTTHFAVQTSIPDLDSTGAVGELLLTRYVLPFEIASIVLLVAMVGAILLAREKEQD